MIRNILGEIVCPSCSREVPFWLQGSDKDKCCFCKKKFQVILNIEVKKLE